MNIIEKIKSCRTDSNEGIYHGEFDRICSVAELQTLVTVIEEAEKACKEAVREFIEKQGNHFPTTTALIHSQRAAFKEMFGEEL